MGFDKEKAYLSGEPGTTGREPFEDSYNSTPGATSNTSGLTGNTHSGHHGHEHHQHGSSGLTGAVGGTDPAVGHQGHGHSGGYSGVGEHSSGQFGGIANVGGDHGNHGSHGDHHHTSGGVGTGRQFDQTGNTKADSETGATHHTSHQGAAHGLDAAAGNVGGHRDTGADVGVQRQEGSALAGSGEDGSKYGDDRVGALGQNSTAYERTGADGPRTTGAAGTDRFDTDRTHTGNAGSGAGFGPGGERHTEYGGNSASGYGGENDVDKRQKAEGTGGVGGMLTTTDKEFTGRDRLGGASGAYGDETGPFKGNKDGPGNNTALTGREGNNATNPVSGDSSKEVHPTKPSETTQPTGTHGHDATGTDAHDGEKKSMVEKIKGAFGA